MDNNHLYMPNMFPASQAEHVLDIEQQLVDQDIAGRMYNPKLTALRAQHMGLMISPMTNKALAVILSPGIVTDMNIPSGTKMVRFNSDGFFVVSRNGRAQLPLAAESTGQISDAGGSFYPAFDTYYYVEEIRQLSILSDMAVRVSVECFAQI